MNQSGMNVINYPKGVLIIGACVYEVILEGDEAFGHTCTRFS